MGEWKHKDEWHKRGKDFLVVVSRHSVSVDEYGGPNRWAVYAYIYPDHPIFNSFDGPDMFQYAASTMPLHGGCSFLRYPMYKSVITSVKVGADYNHLYDDNFGYYETKDEAYEVFNDAAQLFQWLLIRAKGVEA